MTFCRPYRAHLWLWLADALYLVRLTDAALWATLRAARLWDYGPAEFDRDLDRWPP